MAKLFGFSMAKGTTRLQEQEHILQDINSTWTNNSQHFYKQQTIDSMGSSMYSCKYYCSHNMKPAPGNSEQVLKYTHRSLHIIYSHQALCTPSLQHLNDGYFKCFISTYMILVCAKICTDAKNPLLVHHTENRLCVFTDKNTNTYTISTCTLH